MTTSPRTGYAPHLDLQEVVDRLTARLGVCIVDCTRLEIALENAVAEIDRLRAAPPDGPTS